MPGETRFARFLGRFWAAIALLTLVAAGIGAGHWLANQLKSAACVTEDVTLAGVLSLAATLLSLAVTASKDGLEGIAKIWRAATQGGETIRLLDVGRTMIGLAAASVFLSFFFVAQGGCEPPEPPPICSTMYEACENLPAGTECRTCNAHEEVIEEIERLKNDLQELKLRRVGAFPLLFSNARTGGDELTRESHGVHLPARGLERWQEGVFGNVAWPLGEDIGYCVVGHSSIAPFRDQAGKRVSNSDDRNKLVANYRAANFASGVASAMVRQGRRPRVATCRWVSYDTIARPRLVGDDHLSEQDKHLISRSVFVHAVPLTDVAGDLGTRCPSVVAERTEHPAEGLECSELQT